MPTKFEESSGKERIEFIALSEGRDPYCGLMDQINMDQKGTKEKPIEVISPDSDRIIGCSGAGDSHHIAQWMLITEDGHKYWEYGHNRCPECGNTFKLKRIDIPYPTMG
jgi:cytochrome c oxidase subunit 5b